MVARKGLLAPQNTFLDTIAARFDGTRKYNSQEIRLDPSPMLNNMKKEQKFHYLQLNWQKRCLQYVLFESKGQLLQKPIPSYNIYVKGLCHLKKLTHPYL